MACPQLRGRDRDRHCNAYQRDRRLGHTTGEGYVHRKHYPIAARPRNDAMSQFQTSLSRSRRIDKPIDFVSQFRKS
jgi:hypothetical protein